MFRKLSNPIIRRFAALAGGSVAGQLAMFAALPFATRLYTPTEFGLLGTFSAIVMLVLPAACLRFDLAIPIPRCEREARALIVLGVFGVACTTLLLCMFLPFLPAMLGDRTKDLFSDYGWLIPLSLFAAAIFSLAQFWAVRHEKFNVLAMTHVSRGVIGASTQVGLGVAGMGTIGLLLGQSIYMGLGSISLLIALVRQEWQHIRVMTWSEIKQTANRQWRFPLLSTPEAILSAAGMHLPLLIITAISGPETAGVLFLALRVLSIPVALVAGNLSRVYLGEAPKQQEKGNLWGFTWGIWKTLFAISIVPAIIGFFVLTDVLTILLGPEWVGVSNIILIFLPSVLLQFCVVPVSCCLAIKGLMYRSLTLQIFGLISQVGGIYAAYYLGNIDPIQGLAFGAFLFYVVYTATVLWSSKDEL